MEGEPKGSGEIKPVDVDKISQDIADIKKKAQEAARLREQQEAEVLKGHLVNDQALVANRNHILSLGAQAEEALEAVVTEMRVLSEQGFEPDSTMKEALKEAQGQVSLLKAQLGETKKQAKGIAKIPGVEERIINEAIKEDKIFNEKQERQELQEKQNEVQREVKRIKDTALENMGDDITAIGELIDTLVTEAQDASNQVEELRKKTRIKKQEVDSFAGGWGVLTRADARALGKLFDDATTSLIAKTKTMNQVSAKLRESKHKLAFAGDKKRYNKAIDRMIEFLPTVQEVAEAESSYQSAKIRKEGLLGFDRLKPPLQELKERAKKYDSEIHQIEMSGLGTAAYRTDVEDLLFRVLVSSNKVIVDIIKSVQRDLQ